MYRAAFSHEIDGDFLLIRDLNASKSVTNDIENILADLAAKDIALDHHKIIHQDSRGLWDGIGTEGGKFQRFIHINAETPMQAKEKWPAAGIA